MSGRVRGAAVARRIGVSLLGVVVTSIVVLPAHMAAAATDTVTNCSASAATPGSLPYEVANAAAGDTITFVLSPPCSTITLSAAIEISQNLTIAGPGAADLDVSGGGSVGVFTVDSGVTATISGLTVSDADNAAGIDNSGSLSIVDCTVTNNANRGIGNSGALTVTGSTISNNIANGGAGIDSGGTLVVTDSTLTGNNGLGSFGGAIYSGGTSAVNFSTVSGNSAHDGGGIYTTGSFLIVTGSTVSGNSAVLNTFDPATGGGIYSLANLQISDSTISGNTAAGQGGGFSVGGVFASSANTLITNTTVAGNTVTVGLGEGGGIWTDTGGTVTFDSDTIWGNQEGPGNNVGSGLSSNDGTLQMGDTIVAANTHGPNCFRSPVTGVNDFGFNLDDGGSCPLTQPTDLQNTPSGLDPTGLQDHGGFTETIAPLAGSPAIDAVTTPSLCPATDQRGTPRTAPCDIGAYDTDTTGPFSVVPVTGSQTYGGTPTFSWFDITPAGVTLSGSASCSTSGLGAGNDMLDPSTCSGLTSSDLGDPVYYAGVPSGFVVSPDTSTMGLSTDVASEPYGSERSTTFTVTVDTGNGEPIGPGEAVFIQVDSASCTAALTPGAGGGSGGCSIGGDRDLAPGSYTASGTYVGDASITGSGPATTPFTVVAGTPDAPTIGNASMSTVSTASVPFTAPDQDGGSPIDNYDATCTSSNGGTTRTGSDATSPISVAQLDAGKTYTCTVNADNANGDGPQSDPSNSFTVPSVPSAPTAATAVSGSTTTATGTLSVTYAGSAKNGSTITSYDATCTSTSPGAATPKTGSHAGALPMAISVAGVTTGKTYTCVVTATNGVGTGPASASSPPVVVGSPAAPTAVKTVTGSTATTTGTLTVTYTAAANNGSAITSFTATCTSTSPGAATPKTGTHTGATAGPITVTGVTTGKTYTCRVLAHNARGNGLVSAPSPPVIVGSPAAPTNVHAAKVASGHLKVTFTPGANNGSAIVSTTASCVSSNGGVTKSANGTASATSITVTGLSANKTYTCTVHETNARGAGLPSTPSPSTTA